MSKALWLVAGIAIGFAAAHQVSRTPEGRRFFDDVDAKAREFGESIVDGYKAREAELRAAVDSAEQKIADLSK
jgi:DNA-binding MarR family transcriptional regulator